MKGNSHHTAKVATHPCNNTRQSGRKNKKKMQFKSNVTDFVAPMREGQSQAKYAGNMHATT
jgi:hypothetical protein